MSNDKPVRLLDPVEVAEWLSMSEAYLKKLRHERKGPPYLKIGRRVKYHPAQVARWLRAREHGLPEPMTIGRSR